MPSLPLRSRSSRSRRPSRPFRLAPPRSSRRRRARSRRPRSSRASTGSASASRARRARRRSATRPTTRSPSAPTTSSRPSTRAWRSSRRRARQFDTTGKVLYGPVDTDNVFKGFGGFVRDVEQRRRRRALRPARRPLADRHADLPARCPFRQDEPARRQVGRAGAGEPAGRGRAARPRRHWFRRCQPTPAAQRRRTAPRQARARGRPGPRGLVLACATRSAPAPTRSARTTATFLRPLFPDYPRPAVWPDGYYVPTSTGDDVDPEARLRRRAREDAQGRSRDRAGRHHRRRELPQQRRPRRQATPAGRARRTS